MDASLRQIVRSVFRFGSGEFVGRLLYVTIVVLLGHLYGVVIVGVYALATGVSQYLVPIIDFGLKHVGARLVARFPESASQIVRQVQSRRVRMAVACLPFLLLYASLTRLPMETKVFVFFFSATGALYSLTLDWVAWGREQLWLVGVVKAIVPGCILLGLLMALAGGHLLLWLVFGNLVGYSLHAMVLWLWWRRDRSQEPGLLPADAEIVAQLNWRRTGVMGLALFGNMAFNTSDMLVLGAFSGPQQVGLYGASYRILNQVLATYYLLTIVLYPQFARMEVTRRRRMMRPRIFLMLFATGALLAALVALFRRPLLLIVFGRPFVDAAPLLLILACSLPLDFLVSYLSNAYLAWNMERNVLVCAAIATTCNIALNLATIPRFGAMAAAINTLVAYAVYLAALTWKAPSR